MALVELRDDLTNLVHIILREPEVTIRPSRDTRR
jgi:hypothetical protein